MKTVTSYCARNAYGRKMRLIVSLFAIALIATSCHEESRFDESSYLEAHMAALDSIPCNTEFDSVSVQSARTWITMWVRDGGARITWNDIYRESGNADMLMAAEFECAMVGSHVIEVAFRSGDTLILIRAKEKAAGSGFVFRHATITPPRSNELIRQLIEASPRRPSSQLSVEALDGCLSFVTSHTGGTLTTTFVSDLPSAAMYENHPYAPLARMAESLFYDLRGSKP